MTRLAPYSVAALALAGALPTSAPAQDAPAAPTALDRVIVTGTRVSDRTVAESISPIDIITPEALQASGTSELATALARVLPSLNFPRPAITDGTDAVRPAQLRGLAPDQVLVLVNGKRRHTTALVNLNGSQGRGASPVDLNAIPIAAIERVEVLRDGASAQYGSDAIAGVINVVLKGDAGSGSIDARYGGYSAGDGEQVQLTGDGGIALGDNGVLHLAGQALHNGWTDRAGPFQGTPSPTSAPLGEVTIRQGDPEIDQGAVSANLEYGFGEATTFYAFGMASNREATSSGYFRPAGDSRNIPEIYPQGFLPRIVNDARDRSLVAGLRGAAGEWDWDLSYNYGYNQLDFRVDNSLNRTLGPTSQTSFYSGSLEVTQNLVNLDLSRSLDIGLAYPATLAFGLEHREEKFNISPGEPASWVAGPYPGAPGAQVFPGFRPGDAGHFDRDNSSAYVDFEADLTERWSAGIAGRYEDYSDFGSTTAGKLSTRFAFSDAVALRGTVATGFRAPSLQQQYFQSTATNFIGGVPFEVRTFAVDDPAAIALGAEPLEPEESTSYSLGLVLQPADRLYVTVDAYQIEIDDRIILSENLTGEAVAAFLTAAGFPGVTGGRYFTNAIDTRTRGVDLVGSYDWTLAAGDLALTFGYNHNETDITRVAANPPELETGGLDLERIGRVEQGRVTVGAPEDKVTLDATWTSGPLALRAGLTRYGSFEVLNADPARDQTFGAEWVLDVSGTYTVGGWAYTLGADNVTDAYPDEVIFANSNSGQLPWSNNAPFGFNGAFVYGKVGYRW
ncbi:TonB-dependent receptor plug domain-containing protein [Coralloluteibacterium stylophorae]|uniref:TonB-dependent receptor n=1 Tax=Coralloluteibacterium stylophorae TaxID=1776034 RepID=A0A8J8AYY6_9GAMM|nr:TonB-dependent receptor [Coralloluteibacterium stylophorae]MBS7456806.1 TonB-dependent receptor [Coralloluteibacterium stylophorae]